MFLEKNIYLIASIYFWLLFGGIGDTISCDLKKAFSNPFFRHFTAIISIFLLFVIIDKNEEGAVQIWKNTFILYIFYVLLTKSKYYFSIPIIIFVLIDQTFSSEKLFLEKSFDKDNSEKNISKINNIKNIDVYRNYLQIIIIILVVSGFLHYFLRQKNKFKEKFSIYKFIFDINCKNTKFKLDNFSLIK